MGRHKLVHIIGEDHCAADPLPVDLAPAELCPAGIRNAHVQLVFLHLLPVLCRNDMPQRMSVVVFYHLRITGGAGGEVNQHQIVCLCAGVSGGTCKLCGELLHFLVEIAPALVRAAHHDLVLDAGDRGLCLIHLLQDILVVQTYHGVDLCAVSTINQILFRQLQRAGNQNGADFVQCHSAYPVFPAAAQDEHNHCAFPDAQALKIVCGLVRQTGDVRKGERLFLAVVIAPHQRFLFRFLFRPFVHNVKAEVKVIGNVYTIVLFEVLVAVKLDAW